MKFTFKMSDAWGDDYYIIIKAETEKEAWRTATMLSLIHI